jgi:hypothetical protein
VYLVYHDVECWSTMINVIRLIILSNWLVHIVSLCCSNALRMLNVQSPLHVVQVFDETSSCSDASICIYNWRTRLLHDGDDITRITLSSLRASASAAPVSSSAVSKKNNKRKSNSENKDSNNNNNDNDNNNDDNDNDNDDVITIGGTSSSGVNKKAKRDNNNNKAKKAKAASTATTSKSTSSASTAESYRYTTLGDIKENDIVNIYGWFHYSHRSMHMHMHMHIASDLT